MTTASLAKKGTYKILVCDDLAEEGLELFRAQKNFEVLVKLKQTLEELKMNAKELARPMAARRLAEFIENLD